MELATEVKSSFSLGDKVTTKKLGLPAIGTVVGILTPKLYVDLNRGMPNIAKLWSRIYEDWNYNPIIYILYDTPQKYPSKDEYKLILINNNKLPVLESDFDVLYEHVVPISSSGPYPEDDLELYDIEVFNDEDYSV